MQFAWGYATPLILEAALEFRLFDLLNAAAQNGGGIGDANRRISAWVDGHPQRTGRIGVAGAPG